MPQRILVVDDEPQIHRFLKPSLTAAGYDVAAVVNGKDAIRQAAAIAPDAVLLDLGLPDMDGKDVITEIRRWSKIPIVVLSARDREAEKIDALDRGANDYVNKPFAIGELLARLRAALRDFGQISVSSSRISSGNVEIDTAAHTVVCNGAAVHLTPKEFDLLAILVRNSGRVITHRQLLNSVWGPAHADDMQYLRVFIGQLRHKLERDAERPQLIMTEPGIGYRFVSED